jgi:hypothetical protein
MFAQGLAALNDDFFDRLTDRVNAVGTLDDLSRLETEATVSLGAVTSAMNAQVEALAPILALLTPPAANPAEIVTWLTSFITHFLTPYVRPYAVLAEQISGVATKFAALESAIAAKRSELASL